MPFPDNYDHPVEEELLGVEYAYCQSTDFSSKEYYLHKGEIPYRFIWWCKSKGDRVFKSRPH